MNIDPIVIPFALLPIAGLIYFLYLFKTKGFKGAYFGGKILKTYGTFDLTKRGILSGDIKIHTIEDKDEPLIGIEINHKTFASLEMSALTFKRRDIKDLILGLEKALSETENS